MLYISSQAAYGTICSWSGAYEKTYNFNPTVRCSYAGTSHIQTCHPKANPPEVCSGDGSVCADYVCDCSVVTVAPGAHVGVKEVSERASDERAMEIYEIQFY